MFYPNYIRHPSFLPKVRLVSRYLLSISDPYHPLESTYHRAQHKMAAESINKAPTGKKAVDQVEYPSKTLPPMKEQDALAVTQADDSVVDSVIFEMEQELAAAGGLDKGFFQLQFKDPRYFTWVIVAFASMGGLLSGLDQSLISGANLFLPGDLGLDTRQNSLVNSAMPLGAVGGALLLGPLNEWYGRRWSIIISTILYTVGAAVEAGSINFGM